MVKVYGPAMSLDASGTLGKTLTFSKWKGRNYIRNRVVPSNPKSGPQKGRRGMFKFLAQNWNAIIDANKATWDDMADTLVASRFNAYIAENMRRWHNFLAPGQQTPHTASGTVATPSVPDFGASWQENRIELEDKCSAVMDNWGIAIFASLTGAFTTSVGNLIIAEFRMDTDAHAVYWTPPSVATWYFNWRYFTYEGLLGAAIGEEGAIP